MSGINTHANFIPEFGPAHHPRTDHTSGTQDPPGNHATASGPRDAARDTTDSAERLLTARQALASMQALQREGHNYALAELNDGYLQRNVAEASDALSQAVDAEMDALVAQDPTLDEASAAALVAARFDDQPELQAEVRQAAADLLPIRERQRPTGDAVTRLQTAQDALASMQAMALQGHGFATAELNQGHLQQNVHDAESALQDAIAGEIDALRAEDPALDAAAAAALIAARYGTGPGASAAVAEAATEVLLAREVDALIDGVETGDDGLDALYGLDRALQGAPEALRNRVLADARVQAWLEEAAGLLTSPLEPYLDDPDQVGHRNYPEDMLAALGGLQRVSGGLHPDLAASLTEAALPAFEQVNHSLYGGTGMFNGGGVIRQDEALDHLVRLASHVSGAQGDSALIGRIIDLRGENAEWGRGADAVMTNAALDTSIGPALFVELASRGIDVGQGSPLLASMDSVRTGMERSIRPDAASLFELTETPRFAQDMHPLFGTDAEYETALDQLMGDTLGPDWKEQIGAQQDVLAGHGSLLLNQLGQYTALPADHALRPEVDRFIHDILGDPLAQVSISMALRRDPSLAEGHMGEAMLELFAIEGLDAGGQALATEFANLYISVHAGTAVAGLDGGDPLTIRTADARLAALDDPRLAAALGVEADDLGAAVAAMRDSLPGLAGDDAQQGAAQRTLNIALDGIAGFSSDAAAGQVFRGLALTASASALANAGDLRFDDPRVESALGQAIETLGFAIGTGHDIASEIVLLARHFDQIPEGSLLGRYANFADSPGMKLLSAVGVVTDSWNAIQAFGEGDIAIGSLQTLAVGGGVLGLVGGSWAGAWAGPVGLAAVLIAGGAIYFIEKTRHSNRFETPEMRDFLAASGLSATAAGELYDTTGSAVSPVPFLLEYGERHGLDAGQTVGWLNSLSGDQLSQLVRITHKALDGLGTDASGFPETHDTDESKLPQVEAFGVHVLPVPDSYTQFDAAVTHFVQAQTPAEWLAG